MSSGYIPKNSIYSNVSDSTNYGKVHKVINDSGLINYLQLVTNEEILFETNSKKINKKLDQKQFYTFISNLFQSLTNTGYTTYEIVTFISQTVNNQLVNVKPEVIDYLKKSIMIYHSNYEGKLDVRNYRVAKNFLFNHVKSNLGAYTSATGASLLSKKPVYKRDLKTLSAFANFNAANAALVNTATTTDKAIEKSIAQSFKASSFNKNIKNPSKTKTSVSSILVTNPDMKVGTQNALELSAFFNSMNSIELSKAYPFLDATFVLPNISDKGSPQDSHAKLRTSTINQFLFGTRNSAEVTSNYTSFEGDHLGKNRIRTNLSLFSTPQSIVNMNEPIGHAQNHKVKNRLTTVHDPAKPFMTLKNFSINAAPTKGLMSYKTGKLSLVLHDRTRMNDIAPFVKPDLFGVFGAELVLEYGWINSDVDNKNNPLSYFLGNSRVTEKYMIVNSSMSIDNSGLVNIDLSIAMKGPYEFKAQQIETSIANRISIKEISNYFNLIRHNRKILVKSSSIDNSEKLDTISNAILNNFTDIFSSTQRISESSIENIRVFIDNWSFFQEDGTFIINKQKKINLSGLGQDNFPKIVGLLGLKKADGKNGVWQLNNDYDVQALTRSFEEVRESFSNIIQTLKKVVDQDAEEEEREKEIIQSVVGGYGLIDPFFPIDLPENVESEGDYVSLGTIINTIVQGYVANSGNFDEVQTIFYNTNEFCGAMSCYNIATLLVSKFELKELLLGIFSKRTVITPESLITQIILRCIQHKDNPSYGLKDLYKERESVFDPVKPKDTQDESQRYQLKLARKLHEIYYPDEPYNKENDVKFIIPQISMNFDCLTEKKHSNFERTILRISIYDRTEIPFASSANILEQIYGENLLKPINLLAKTRKDLKSGKGTRKSYIENAKKEIQKLVKEGILLRKGKKLFINHKNISRNSKLSSSFIGNTKDFYKQIYPSLTFGTQNTALISANVSTINENKLQTIFLTRPDRNNQNEINNRVNADLPLRILPTQASVEIVGCPWINFGQSIFLDFETGTTIDNKYVVTGITHNLSPGKFTTSLKLSYGDNYGQFESSADLIDKLLKETGGEGLELFSSNAEETLSEKDFGVPINAIPIRKTWKTDLGGTGFINTGLIALSAKSIKVPIYSDIVNKFSSIFCFLIYNNSFLEKLVKSADILKEMKSFNIKNNTSNFSFTKASKSKPGKGENLSSVISYYLNTFSERNIYFKVIEDKHLKSPVNFVLVPDQSNIIDEANLYPFVQTKSLNCKVNPKYKPSFFIEDSESLNTGLDFFIDISKSSFHIDKFKKLEPVIKEQLNGSDIVSLINTIGKKSVWLEVEATTNLVLDKKELLEREIEYGDAAAFENVRINEDEVLFLNDKITKKINLELFDKKESSYFKIFYKTKNQFMVESKNIVKNTGSELINKVEIKFDKNIKKIDSFDENGGEGFFDMTLSLNADNEEIIISLITFFSDEKNVIKIVKLTDSYVSKTPKLNLYTNFFKLDFNKKDENIIENVVNDKGEIIAHKKEYTYSLSLREFINQFKKIEYSSEFYK